MNEKIFAVSELNNIIKQILDAEAFLNKIYVCGEISNYKLYPSGHHYFTLKDKESALRCVMFKGNAASLRFKPDNGMKVIALGRVSAYPRDGVYQLYCSGITPDGIGDLYTAFEQLKEKLYKEGLFDREKKKQIPRYPERIAIITSPAGAAIRDMIRVLGARYPIAKVTLLPVRVQGDEAPREICAALRYANEHRAADLIITGRGGGSIEDLWAFNDEGVARAIYASEIPVISAVGHEPDVTISDFVADLRAATPSNAAELAVPDMFEIKASLDRSVQFMESALSRKLSLLRERFNTLSNSRVLKSPLAYVDDKRIALDLLQDKLARVSLEIVTKKKSAYIGLASTLDAMSPLKVLNRGYSIVKREDGALIKDSGELKRGDNINVRLSRGSVNCQVIEAVQGKSGYAKKGN